MTQYDFGFKEPFANGADSSEIQPFPDEDRGLGIAFVQTDGKPEMKGLNGLFNKITKALLSLRQNGLLGWVNDLEYKKGGFVVENDLLYQAKRNNTNKQPSLSQSDWAIWGNASNISVDANDNIKKDVKPDGSFSLKVEDASVEKKGVLNFANASQVINKVATLVGITPKNAADIAQSTDFGIGQDWQVVTGSRSIGTLYTNNSDKPREIQIGFPDSNGRPQVIVTVTTANGSVEIIDSTYDSGGNFGALQLSFTVPPRRSYVVDVYNIFVQPNKWSELI